MNILPAPKGMPTILLARAGKYDAGRTLAAAEAAGAWAAWKKAAPTLSPGGGHPAGRRRRPARPRRRRLPDRPTSGAPRRRRGADSATWSPTASRPTPARRSTAR